MMTPGRTGRKLGELSWKSSELQGMSSEVRERPAREIAKISDDGDLTARENMEELTTKDTKDTKKRGSKAGRNAETQRTQS